MRTALLVFSVLLVSIAVSPAIGERAPGFAVADRLKPYADPKIVADSGRTVIQLLAAAKIESVANGLDPDCNTPEVESFYRGMHLAHLAYYLFLSRQEVGRFEDSSPTQTEPPRAFVDFGRNSLLRVWTPSLLLRLLNTAASIDDLPADSRSDLARFLAQVREFRAYQVSLRPADAELQALYGRLSDEKYLRHWRLFLPDDGVEGIRRQFPDRTLFNFDEELRTLVNTVRPPDLPALSKCYEAGSAFRIVIEDRAIDSTKLLLPISYMVRFWDRREAEGTADLADFLLEQAISRLQSKGD
ncbi:hypothetical protein [Hyphomicrobium sp. NDB2Meth4]|uniref:hypothetical protein n=1 Tax=Hyphomicrobium sp. NDB2Meth4 TaxID=1892846 RepID=UPI000A3EA5E2|nr:hypothetical protein [Hyphomicrobium sp. NDB2Meth4]